MKINMATITALLVALACIKWSFEAYTIEYLSISAFAFFYFVIYGLEIEKKFTNKNRNLLKIIIVGTILILLAILSYPFFIIGISGFG